MTAKAGSNWCCPRTVHRPEASGGTHESARRATSRPINGVAAMSGYERAQPRRQETLGKGRTRGVSGERGLGRPFRRERDGEKEHACGEEHDGRTGRQVELERQKRAPKPALS